MERSDLAKIFFIAGWERERAESQEREGERSRGLNTPQWDLKPIGAIIANINNM
jgi:hypothetical protein